MKLVFSRVAVLGLSAAVLLSAGAALADAPAKSMPYKVTAAKDASYTMKCRFPTTTMPNGGKTNGVEFKAQGPKSGALPAATGVRCSLTKLAGTGPVTLTLTKGGPKVLTATTPGQEMKLSVF